jgi:hypothetical protein
VATGGLDDIISIFDVTDAKQQLGANNGDGEDDLTDYDPILQLPKPLSSPEEGHEGYITGCHFLQSDGTQRCCEDALFFPQKMLHQRCPPLRLLCPHRKQTSVVFW